MFIYWKVEINLIMCKYKIFRRTFYLFIVEVLASVKCFGFYIKPPSGLFIYDVIYSELF